jgi:hypothetical protein
LFPLPDDAFDFGEAMKLLDYFTGDTLLLSIPAGSFLPTGGG